MNQAQKYVYKYYTKKMLAGEISWAKYFEVAMDMYNHPHSVVLYVDYILLKESQ